MSSPEPLAPDQSFLDEDRKRSPDVSSTDHKRAVRLLISFYGAILAYDRSDETPERAPSLDNCDRSRGSDAVGRFSESDLSGVNLGPVEQDALNAVLRLGIEDVDEAVRLIAGGGDRLEAVWAALGRGEDRQEKVIELLRRDLPGKAKRLALCRRKSAQLECPDDFAAQGCGSDDNYVPARCGLRICPGCATANKAEKLERYASVVEDMDQPTMLGLTIENVDDFSRGVDFITDKFARLRDRTIPTSGEVVRRKDGERIEKSWCWSIGGEGAASIPWKSYLLENGRHGLARHLQRHYVNAEYENITGTHRGKNIPFMELVDGGIYAVDIKAEKAADGDGYNVHLHAIVDMAYVPQAALSAVWEDLTGSPVVDVRRIYERGEDSAKDALMETIGYALKEPGFDDVSDEVDYLEALEGRAMVHPFGSLHGNIPDVVTRLVCSNCENTPMYWNYLGLVDGEHDNMGCVHGVDGDRPPPS